MWDHGVKGLDVHCVEEAWAGVIVVKLKSSKDLKRMVGKRNFQILNSTPGIVAQLITNIPLMKGTVPKRLDIC